MPLLTQEEVAAILRCSPKTVYRLRRSGKLPYLDGARAMRPVKIRSEDLERWIVKNALGPRKGVRPRRVPNAEEQKRAKLAYLIERVGRTARIRRWARERKLAEKAK
jgi:excisionase family DNA binding protein